MARRTRPELPPAAVGQLDPRTLQLHTLTGVVHEITREGHVASISGASPDDVADVLDRIIDNEDQYLTAEQYPFMQATIQGLDVLITLQPDPRI